MHTRYLTICRFRQDVAVNRAKRLWFPEIRGTWLPSFDRQVFRGGMAINWLGLRIRVGGWLP